MELRGATGIMLSLLIAAGEDRIEADEDSVSLGDTSKVTVGDTELMTVLTMDPTDDVSEVSPAKRALELESGLEIPPKDKLEPETAGIEITFGTLELVEPDMVASELASIMLGLRLSGSPFVVP